MNYFISYTQADLSWAEWIAWQLEESGLQTILQSWDFRAGCNFVLEMDSASKQAQRTIAAVLSASYVNAAYTHPEWASALARNPTGEKRALLPIRVHECALTGLLAQVVHVDLVGLSEVEAKSRLLSQVQGERGKPRAAPRFPGRPAGPAIKAPPYPAADASTHAGETCAPSSRPSIIGSETEVVTKAEQDLIPYVGPVAKVLVRRAVAKAGTTADLYAELAAAIPFESERQEFLRRATDQPGAGISRSPTPSGGSQQHCGIFSASVLEQVDRDLTGHLGPIAKLAVDQESGSATTLEDLYRRLSEHLPAGAERLAFLERLPVTC